MRKALDKRGMLAEQTVWRVSIRGEEVSIIAVDVADAISRALAWVNTNSYMQPKAVEGEPAPPSNPDAYLAPLDKYEVGDIVAVHDEGTIVG